MGGDLLSVVLQRADQDDALPEAAKLLVMAALEGDDVLAAELGRPPTATSDDASQPPDAGAPAPGRAFLTAVRVEGFRGIGERSTLDITPGPGLTVIAGRNGCGKSSFAEALEVALTTGSYRWKTRRSSVWSESWRNLHQPATATIEVEFTQEGHGVTTVGVSWPPGAGCQRTRSFPRGRTGGVLAGGQFISLSAVS